MHGCPSSPCSGRGMFSAVWRRRSAEFAMEYSRESDRTYTVGLLSGLAIGALAMYLLDPVQGRRRRALVTDETYRTMVTTRKTINAKARDLGNRTEGLAAKLEAQ